METGTGTVEVRSRLIESRRERAQRFGRRLCEVMQRQSVSFQDEPLEDLAARIGLTPETLTACMNGRALPQQRTIGKLAVGLGVSTKELELGSESGKTAVVTAGSKRLPDPCGDCPDPREVLAARVVAEIRQRMKADDGRLYPSHVLDAIDAVGSVMTSCQSCGLLRRASLNSSVTTVGRAVQSPDER